MKTVNEVSKLTGVSIRTLQYYDKIGLLTPAMRTEAGYRLYDDTALERLQQILLFRELEFSLSDIKAVLEAPDFDRKKALTQQIELLTLKKQRLEAIIGLAREIRDKGEDIMDFNAFDTSKIEEYTSRAKAEWGDTKEYEEYAKKSSKRTKEDENNIASGLMAVFADFGKLKDGSPDSPEAAEQVRVLQKYITENYYHCTDDILMSLGQMYSANGEFNENIDNAGGIGTADFVTKAIGAYIGNK
ncbi:MerR family transcriptional regulator [Ruminococcus albus]|uniref:DNA-binding transcriptional regulator, MerR family n=1 Tax=Ruminococcus albus TaxID=1264 RepID=A0A1I1FDK8_RUMAL|nr:MerR family transcriptional regulator [Ruminococcus albus]SFB97371.1 DNA-binding transcriptional regulator, MerR family [Ruminococcus albus]